MSISKIVSLTTESQSTINIWPSTPLSSYHKATMSTDARVSSDKQCF